MPKHPETRAERRARAALAKARAAVRLAARAPNGTPPAYMDPPPVTPRAIGLHARTPAACSCRLCRPTPHMRPTLAAIIAAELATY